MAAKNGSGSKRGGAKAPVAKRERKAKEETKAPAITPDEVAAGALNVPPEELAATAAPKRRGRPRKGAAPADPLAVVPTDDEPETPEEAAGAAAGRADAAAGRVVTHDEMKGRRKAKAAAEPEAPPAARAEHYRELTCALTDDEVARKAGEMAAAVGRRHQIEDERREYAGRTRADLKGLQGQIEQLAEQVRSRAEERSVKCKTVQDQERKKVAVFRLDTMECLDVRDMSEQEAARAREEQKAGGAKQLGADAVAAIRQWERDRGKFAAKAAAAQAEKHPPSPPAASPGFDLAAVPGVPAKVAKALQAAEYGTLAALRVATIRDLCAVEGVGTLIAERVLLYVEENYPPGEASALDAEEAKRNLALADRIDDILSDPAADDAPPRPVGKEAVEQAASDLRAAAALDAADVEVVGDVLGPTDEETDDLDVFADGDEPQDATGKPVAAKPPAAAGGTDFDAIFND